MAHLGKGMAETEERQGASSMERTKKFPKSSILTASSA